ncbi:glycosyltransferase family 2 protein [Actinacidiphila paucisporea]|uniref:Glycosyltransferase, GT2 family n=1 Tax=Actinacidiphila paucisporea TaxID=310782 RepID=A0A1M7ML88_9ACTN|nr:glycosyltransferase [Actinacidiphila paucisporea]SHM91640.1 Glycosyltransferase, GT2 family [Actinacidiphila paucisporea]
MDRRGNIVLSVVIPSYYNVQCLELVLQSLAGQTMPADKFEVIVVYNGCEPPARLNELRANTPYLLRELTSPKGWSQARNTGILAATAERLLLLDNDSLCPPDLLERHWRLAEKDPHSVVMGGRGELGVQGWAALQAVMNGKGVADTFPVEHDVRARSAPSEPWMYGFTNNFGLNRADALAVGAFDVDFDARWGGEDLDISYKLYRHFGRDRSRFDYEPTLRVWHVPHYRNLRKSIGDHFASLALLRDKHRHYEVELIAGLPEVLAGSLADIAERVTEYRRVMAVCAEAGLCSIAPWRAAVESLLGQDPQRPDLVVGYGTSGLGPQRLITFDYGRDTDADNLHLLGVDVPFAEGTFRAAFSFDFWRLLRMPDLLAFITTALLVADELYLAASEDLIARGPELGLDALVDLRYFAELVEPVYQVTSRQIAGVGTLLRVVPAS